MSDLNLPWSVRKRLRDLVSGAILVCDAAAQEIVKDADLSKKNRRDMLNGLHQAEAALRDVTYMDQQALWSSVFHLHDVLRMIRYAGGSVADLIPYYGSRPNGANLDELVRRFSDPVDPRQKKPLTACVRGELVEILSADHLVTLDRMIRIFLVASLLGYWCLDDERRRTFEAAWPHGEVLAEAIERLSTMRLQQVEDFEALEDVFGIPNAERDRSDPPALNGGWLTLYAKAGDASPERRRVARTQMISLLEGILGDEASSLID